MIFMIATGEKISLARRMDKENRQVDAAAQQSAAANSAQA
jgi:hypothetical protein